MTPYYAVWTQTRVTALQLRATKNNPTDCIKASQATHCHVPPSEPCSVIRILEFFFSCDVCFTDPDSECQIFHSHSIPGLKTIRLLIYCRHYVQPYVFML